MIRRLSLVLAVFDRPGELQELLQSLAPQCDGDVEIIVVEDGSTETSQEVVASFSDRMDIKYFAKANSGCGTSRNYGCERASGDFFIFLDSDCIVSPGYIDIVRSELARSGADAFGGPDRAHPDFSAYQKAVSFSMTSLLTTGGIRGGNEKVGKFRPRGFNMGFSREVYETTGGFSAMRFGEDVDHSLTLLERGFKSILIREAFVYHKRRASLRPFFKQVHNSGIARITLHKRHPGSLKAVHCAPALFTLGLVALILAGAFLTPWVLAPIAAHMGALFVAAVFESRSLTVGLLAIPTSYIQLVGYGSGFIRAFWWRVVLRRGQFSAFEKSYYK